MSQSYEKELKQQSIAKVFFVFDKKCKTMNYELTQNSKL